MEWLEKQLGDKEEVIDLLRSRLDAGEEHKVALASSWEQTRVALARAEERVAASASEINKGNAIIEELQSDIRSLKSKMKIQTAVIKRQEALLDERGAAALAVAGERAERSLETRELVDQNRQLTERNQTLDAELTDARATLESNKRVIDWLNTELSAASLRGGPRPAAAAARRRRPSLAPHRSLLPDARVTKVTDVTHEYSVPPPAPSPPRVPSSPSPAAAEGNEAKP